MGKHSSLGPIDPQIGRVPAHGVIEEFNRAAGEIRANPASANLWAPILAKYSPTFIGECQKALTWSSKMVTEWLTTGMFAGETDAAAKADNVMQELGDHSLTLSHARHISADKAASVGLKIVHLEADEQLQDLVLTAHHITVQTLNGTPAFKIIENQNGVALIQTVATSLVPA